MRGRIRDLQYHLRIPKTRYQLNHVPISHRLAAAWKDIQTDRDRHMQDLRN